MSVTRQKLDLRLAIREAVAKYLEETPFAAHLLVMSTVQQLTRRMTLKELEEWYARLSGVGVVVE